MPARASTMSRVGRAGERQELVDLVRCDVDEDAAVLRAIEEPRIAKRAVQPVRAQADGLHDVADRPVTHQLERARHGTNFEALGEVDGVDPARLALDGTHAIELLERRHARLVGHEILAGPHRLDRMRGAIARDRGTGDQLDRRVVQQPRPIRDARNVREPLDEAFERLRRALRPDSPRTARQRRGGFGPGRRCGGDRDRRRRTSAAAG